MKGITSMGHVAIRVKDFDRALEFYVAKLGFSEMFRLDRDGRFWIIYLRVTDDQYLELFSDAIGDRAPATEGVGLNHLCLTVDDLDSVIDQLAENGVPLTRPKKMALDRNNRRGSRTRRQPHRADADGDRLPPFRSHQAAPGHSRVIRYACAIAIALATGGCASPAREVIWWTPNWGQARAAELARRFEAVNPGLSVRVEITVPDGLPTRIQTALRSGSAPDVIDAQHGWVVPYAQAACCCRSTRRSRAATTTLPERSTTTRGTGSCGASPTALKRTPTELIIPLPKCSAMDSLSKPRSRTLSCGITSP